MNIPSDVNTLPRGIGESTNRIVLGTTQYSNDYGATGFGGVCPPKGHGPHHYLFNVHALSQVLELPENPTSAIVAYMVNGHTIDTASIEALYELKKLTFDEASKRANLGTSKANALLTGNLKIAVLALHGKGSNSDVAHIQLSNLGLISKDYSFAR